MKKILLALTIGFISFSAYSNCHAQNAVTPMAFNHSKHFKSAVQYTAALEPVAYSGNYVADGKSINKKAMRDFESRFNQAGSAKWFSDANGYISYFEQNGYNDRAFYDHKGHWKYSLIFYNEKKLPHDIRATVKSTYYDLTISLVEEVQTPDGSAYFVHLEDDSTIKIVKVYADCEMELVQDLSKQ
jgi:hypothetical protein